MARYHVRRHDREITDPATIASILLRGRFTTLAMVHDGDPYVLTMSYGHDADNARLYFHAATAGRKLDAIAADPRAQATVIIDGGYRDGDCAHDYESVVMDGRLRVVTDREEQLHGMRILVGHNESDPATVWERNKLDGEAVYERMLVLAFDIEATTAKAGS
jgi:nitroimidazol reductase NimA-like FMN-containing flavoprotein (pyridoxamine 5'-phosphate oxidase superfamily)